MIKFIQCVRRKPELSIQEFRRYWGEYERRVAELAAMVGAAGATSSVTLAVDANLQVMTRRRTSQPFDAVAEVWWERAPDLSGMEEDPGIGRALAAYQALQEEFMDLERSSFFFTKEDAIHTPEE
jgi:hypothetical protein